MPKISTPILVAIVVVVVIVILGVVYYAGKGAGDKKPRPKKKDLPTGGSGIPLGWDPEPDARKLHSAMDGWGTDEEMIWAVLEGKTDDQLAAIKNEFDRLFFDEHDEDLFDWLEGDLGTDDYARAIGYFKNVA